MTPREYASQICAEPTKEGRRALLETVPAEFRELVKTHVRIQFERRRAGRVKR